MAKQSYSMPKEQSKIIFLALLLTYLWHLELYLVLSKHLVFLVQETTMLIRRSILSQIFVFPLENILFQVKNPFLVWDFLREQVSLFTWLFSG